MVKEAERNGPTGAKRSDSCSLLTSLTPHLPIQQTSSTYTPNSIPQSTAFFAVAQHSRASHAPTQPLSDPRRPPSGPPPTARTASAQPWQSNAMAMITGNQMNTSSNYRRSSSAGSTGSSGRRSAANTTASAYLVNAATMGLTGFHYSTCGAGGTYFHKQKRYLVVSPYMY